MASNSLLILFAVAALLAQSILATEFTVGDDAGWTINFDYQAWTAGKTFYVGDTLVFKYTKGVHDVNRVNLTAFQQCLFPSNGVLETGNDVIALATPGKKWYICGKSKHCEVGKQKLAITVESASPSPSPAPGPPSSSAAKVGSSSGIIGWIAAAFTAHLMAHLV